MTCSSVVALGLIVFMRFATLFGAADPSSGSADMEFGSSRRGRNELSGLLRGQDMKYLVNSGTRNSQKGTQKKSGRRQSFY